MSGQLIVEIWGDKKMLQSDPAHKIRTLVNYDPLNVGIVLAMIRELGVEDQEGQIWKYESARVDLGSATPRLDVFMTED